MNRQFDWKKYGIVFFITTLIFATAFFVSNYFGNKKLDALRAIQDQIAMDILSSETQFSLLEESSCKEIGTSTLSEELGSLGDKLSYTEEQRGADDAEVESLKRYYSLLQVKDYLLTKKISERCKLHPITVIYFYSNKGDCPDCQREGYVLTRLREEHPDVRVYAFDYNLDSAVIRTLIGINKIKAEFPVLIVNDETYYGFKNIDDLTKIVPALKTASSTPTTK